jgi:hypothetical protein
MQRMHVEHIQLSKVVEQQAIVIWSELATCAKLTAVNVDVGYKYCWPANGILLSLCSKDDSNQVKPIPPK